MNTAVTVEAPARLHLGFFDLHGGLGRRFGSLGLTLEQPLTRVRLATTDVSRVTGLDAHRAGEVLQRLRERFAIDRPLELEIEQSIPAHAGLGSGTQLTLAVAAAFQRLFSIDYAPRRMAALLDRGVRSGIGIGAFEQGGFLVDGGRGDQTLVPPTIVRLPFPESWRVVLMLDNTSCGLHGEREQRAFQQLPDFPEALAGHLSRVTLSQILPGLAEADLRVFGAGINELQHVIGDYFAPAQGGRYASSAVALGLEWLAQQGVVCCGQSSWGPTGFAVVESPAAAQRLDHLAAEAGLKSGPLQLRITAARNTGASVRHHDGALLQARSRGITSSTSAC